jgi:chromosome segregation ATPase
MKDTLTMTSIERIEELIAEQVYTERRIVELGTKLDKEEDSLSVLKSARKIVQVIVASTQVRFKDDVESLMTSAINSVFKRFSFELEWKTSSNRSDLNFNIRDGEHILNLEDDMGCSILDLVSLTSRPVFHRYQQHPSRKLFVYDEPGKWLGQGKYLDRTFTLLRMIADEQKYQFIIITHEKKFARIADATFHVTNDGVKSSLKPIDDIAVLEVE